MKTLAYFPLQCANNSRPVIQAVTKACRFHGIDLRANSLDCDGVLVWSVLFAGRMLGNKSVYEYYAKSNRKIIVVDVGSLQRNQTWKVAINNINAQGWYGNHINLDPDRPRKLGIELRHTKAQHPYIMVALQHSQSLQVAGIDLVAWLEEKANSLRAYTDRPLVIRPHPRDSNLPKLIPKKYTIQSTNRVKGSYDDFDIDFRCHAVINYNSSIGSQAAIQGCRIITDETSLAYPVSIPVSSIEHTYDIDRHSWFLSLCHTEYTISEIESGLWLKRLDLLT